ncbi:MAG: ion transporter [Leptospiraceae bacterium]|nr:ion transporter [Leptospiraceae bacterium]
MPTQRRYAEDHFPHIFEITILILIFLAICHLCLEELAVILAWDTEIHKNLILGAFAFDLIFSLEFLGRSVVSIREGRFLLYFTRQRGWVDFLSSIPLAALVSGPAIVLLFLNPEGQVEHLPQYMVLLKTAKAVRVTRALRLIRMLRVFGRVQYTESQMSNHHVASVATITVTTLIFSLFILQLLPFSPVPGHGPFKMDVEQKLSEYLDGRAISYEKPDPQLFASAFPSVLTLKDGEGNTLYEKQNRPPDWVLSTEMELPGKHTAVVSYYEADSNLALLILCMLGIILILLICYVAIYGRLFVQYLAEPIYMMDRGLRQWNYNLRVPEITDRPQDEIARLVSIYNRRWLPLKERIVAHYEKKKHPEKDITGSDHGRPLHGPDRQVSIDELI